MPEADTAQADIRAVESAIDLLGSAYDDYGTASYPWGNKWHGRSAQSRGDGKVKDAMRLLSGVRHSSAVDREQSALRSAIGNILYPSSAQRDVERARSGLRSAVSVMRANLRRS